MGSSSVKKERKPVGDGGKLEGPSKKRAASFVDIIDLSGDSDDLKELDTEDLAHLARIKVRPIVQLSSSIAA